MIHLMVTRTLIEKNKSKFGLVGGAAAYEAVQAYERHKKSRSLGRIYIYYDVAHMKR